MKTLKDRSDPRTGKWISQLRKGILDFIILIYLRQREYYGYELIRDIKAATGLSLTEGTVYPLLNRLKKEGLIEAHWVESESGVPRKYYGITAPGLDALAEMKQQWADLENTMNRLLEAK